MLGKRLQGSYADNNSDTLFSPSWSSRLGKAFGKDLQILFFDGFRSAMSPGVSRWRQQECYVWSGVQELLEKGAPPDVRIISIHSSGCVQPLHIRAPMMHQILERYHVAEDFLTVLESIGDAPQLSRAGLDGAFRKSADGQSSICSYRIQYPELNQRSPHVPFSLRHTGVYHQRNTNSKPFDLFILLHPIHNSPLETSLRSLATPNPNDQSQLARCLQQDVSFLHAYILELYMVNWKDYLHHLNEHFVSQNDEIETFDVNSASFTQGLVPAQGLRHLYDCAVIARILCVANVSIVESLASHFPEAAGSNRQPIYVIEREDCDRLDKCQQGFAMLQDRVNNTNGLLEYAVNFRNQEISAKINETLRNDSQTVRIITILSLIFLPGSFTATLYGMNFFEFSPTSNGLVLGSNFWIFVATWLPVTFLTLCIYMAVKWRTDNVHAEAQARTSLNLSFRAQSWRRKRGPGVMDYASGV
ncbi:uncharacterized protein Z518_08458 [Rhinocladiella mackenziei CBS 650.93]|uniref:Uncharacterized protein n=1 Tax=Rhinocladiella mackenziei CBS 650.93 TaxID=1442369 RepID=A0A0D2FKT4_9EURO|nr:uncharacterized protein Z518_08458 [Rhinocladiella mackenziei CBS 650.93]KIX02517.1 hypothetical protein Z518_08458 [Rhinocladiella mackenziei CBS 650.93]